MDEIIKDLPSGGVIGAICLILGLVLGRGVDALIKLRQQNTESKNLEQKNRLEVQALEDKRVREGFDLLIKNLNDEVKIQRDEFAVLLKELKDVQLQHLDCVREQERMRGKDEQREAEIHVLRNEVDKLRQWRHDVADKAQTIVAETAVRKLEGQLPPSSEG